MMSQDIQSVGLLCVQAGIGRSRQTVRQHRRLGDLPHQVVTQRAHLRHGRHQAQSLQFHGSRPEPSIAHVQLVGGLWPLATSLENRPWLVLQLAHALVQQVMAGLRQSSAHILSSEDEDEGVA